MTSSRFHQARRFDTHRWTAVACNMQQWVQHSANQRLSPVRMLTLGWLQAQWEKTVGDKHLYMGPKHDVVTNLDGADIQKAAVKIQVDATTHADVVPLHTG